jgi:hypothetical protein
MMNKSRGDRQSIHSIRRGRTRQKSGLALCVRWLRYVLVISRHKGWLYLLQARDIQLIHGTLCDVFRDNVQSAARAEGSWHSNEMIITRIDRILFFIQIGFIFEQSYR